ncbi:MAG: DUF2330 domain-containing protein [Planctomycetota bacterium]
MRIAIVAITSLLWTSLAMAYPDGKVMPPVDFKGTLEETSQEAVLIFHKGTEQKSATQDMILKIRVEGEASEFGWVVPLPNAPETFREDAALFEELERYVEMRLEAEYQKRLKGPRGNSAAGMEMDGKVEVISRKIVGSYDIAVVKENAAGALNDWLADNGYQTLENAEDVLGFYRRKGYVYACIKVTETELDKVGSVDLHPLRFHFETGGRDGIFFPMKLTGLQEAKFDVRLHVFYEKWINDKLSPYGYEHRGFRRKWRDFDSRQCEPNAGKGWSAPQNDPYLKGYSRLIPNLSQLFQKLYPGDRFYLTTIQSARLDPKQVRDWADDLWLFPYYTDPEFVPYDARPGGAAATAYQHLK